MRTSVFSLYSVGSVLKVAFVLDKHNKKIVRHTTEALAQPGGESVISWVFIWILGFFVQLHVHTAVQLCTALIFVYGVQSVLCCTKILYSTIQMFIRFQIKLVCVNFLNCVQFVLCRVSTLLYRNTVQLNTDVHQTSNITGLCKFPKLCTVCAVQCTVAYKCAVQKYCTALYKCSSMLK